MADVLILRIEEWKKMSEGSGLSRPSALLSVEPTATIFEAAKILLEHKIHRLPVIDSRSGYSSFKYIIIHLIGYTLVIHWKSCFNSTNVDISTRLCLISAVLSTHMQFNISSSQGIHCTF